jgi:hypothetical protein
MKKIFPASRFILILLSLITILCLTAFVPAPRLPGIQIDRLPAGLAFAQVQVPAEKAEDLTIVQVTVIGIIAMVVVQGLKLLTAKLGKPIDRKWISVALFIFALILAYFWKSPALPALPTFAGEPGAIALSVLTFAGNLIVIASALIGFAMLIYNLFMDKVFNAVSIGKDTIDRLAGVKTITPSSEKSMIPDSAKRPKIQ